MTPCEQILYHLEMQSLIELSTTLKEHSYTNSDSTHLIAKRTSFLKSIGSSYSDYMMITNSKYKNIDSLYLTHWYYFYKGKFHPQMIRSIINIMKLKPGDILLDPFSGSGTTGLEASLLGIDSIGVDISPLCSLISGVKIESVFHIREIECEFARIQSSSASCLCSLDAYNEFLSRKQLAKEVNDFYVAAWISAKKESLFIKKSMSSVFPRHLNDMVSYLRIFADLIENINLTLGNAYFITGDCRHLPLSSESIDGIITSPPYYCALDYIKNELEGYDELGIDPHSFEDRLIGSRDKSLNSYGTYLADLRLAFCEMFRVLRKDCFAVIIIGNNSYFGRKFNNVKNTIELMDHVGFNLMINIPKEITGKKSLLLRENILFFQK